MGYLGLTKMRTKLAEIGNEMYLHKKKKVRQLLAIYMQLFPFEYEQDEEPKRIPNFTPRIHYQTKRFILAVSGESPLSSSVVSHL